MDKHKRGNAFKEKLNQLNQTPNDLVWDNIVKQLDKKEKKKRPFVFWLKTGVVAAILAFLFTLGYNFYSNKKNENTIVLTKEDDTYIKTEKHKINNKNQITSTSNNTINNKNIKPQILKSNNKNLIFQVNTSKYLTNSTKNNNLNLVKINTKKQNVSKTNFNRNSIKQINNIISAIPSRIEKIIIDDSLLNNLIKKREQKLENEKLLNKKITNQNIDLAQLNDKITDKEESLKSEKKWRISIKGSPIYYSSLSNGSSLDTGFKNNSKNSDITLSYSVTASYPINNKLQIRSGISNINLAYNTKEASSTSIINAQALTNIEVQNIIVDSFPEIANPSQGSNFSLKQKINYLEIPLELKYNVLNKKINIDLITGFSTLILNNDKILLNNDNVGSVNNLNKISYTGNLGLGLDYNINKKINFIIEPTVKIQLNTYNDNTDYKPYFFGIYSGFSYKF